MAMYDSIYHLLITTIFKTGTKAIAIKRTTLHSRVTIPTFPLQTTMLTKLENPDPSCKTR